MKDLYFIQGAISNMQIAEAKLAVAVQDAVLIAPTHVQESYIHSLSNLDQLNALIPCYLPMLYFFRSGAESPSSATKLVAGLKQALADALELYPVLAGRLRKGKGERLEVEINGAGVEFSVATTEARLDAWKDLRLCTMALQLVPKKPLMPEEMLIGAPLACVQVTTFQCGGVAICITFLHAVGDMQAFSEFVEAWARACINKDHTEPLDLIAPRLDTAALLRPRDPPTISVPIDALVHLCGDQHTANKVSEKEASSNGDLHKVSEKEASSNGDLQVAIATAAGFLRMGHAKVAEAVHEVETGPYSYGHPSSFEAVAGLLWVAITRARDLPPDSYTRFALPVNMRRRWCPPLPPLFFGNASLPAMAVARSGDLLERHFSYAARLVHESIVAIDSEYGQAAVDWLETQLQQHGKVSLGGLMMNDGDLHASVMTGYSLYELDFGWGRPIHASLPIHVSIPFGTPFDLSGSILVMSTPSGARESVIFLKINHMNKLIEDPFISRYLEGEEQLVHELICPPKFSKVSI